MNDRNYKDDTDSEPRLLAIFKNRKRLEKANLTGAYLRNAMLYETDLSDLNLSGADLAKATLNGCDLRNTDLSNTNLCETSLCGVDMTGARLSESFITGALFSHNTVLPDGVLWMHSKDPLAALTAAGAKWSWRFPPALH